MKHRSARLRHQTDLKTSERRGSPHFLIISKVLRTHQATRDFYELSDRGVDSYTGYALIVAQSYSLLTA